MVLACIPPKSKNVFRVLAGLFSWDHMKYEFQREKRANQGPILQNSISAENL
jgi:hypothetical protein